MNRRQLLKSILAAPAVAVVVPKVAEGASISVNTAAFSGDGSVPRSRWIKNPAEFGEYVDVTCLSDKSRYLIRIPNGE